METKNYLGIYISKDTATVVCLSPQGRDHKVVGCFSVSAGEQAEQKHQQLATLISQGCTERNLQFSEVAVALDCAMFMQNDVHSEFKDMKQISQTVRFDTEEALATDIGDIAIAFKINSSDDSGSDLSVFTAERKVLSDVILSLQSSHMDPVSVEPDVSCLSRFVYSNVSFPEDSHVMFGALSRRSGYFISPNSSGSKDTGFMRTFLAGPKRTRTEQLAREVYVTTALLESEAPLNCLKVFDSTGSVDYEKLTGRLGFEAGGVDLAEAARTDPQTLADCSDTVDFAIAYGAALAHLGKPQCINFRSDFMPFQGRKRRLEKTLKLASVSVTVLLIALGVYLQMPLLKINDYRSQVRKKFARDYTAVMLGKPMPAKFADALRRLGSVEKRIQDVQSGRFGATGEESVATKLTLVLEAFTKCASATNLSINKVSVTSKSIRIEGETSDRRSTLTLRKAIEASGLVILQDDVRTEGRRDSFNLTVAPKK